MATATRTVGPADHDRRLSLAEFAEADFEDGWLYELARGVIVVTEVPGINHGRIVMRLSSLFALYESDHPGVINYRAGGMECRIRLPGMASDRHPDQAIYLDPPTGGEAPWTSWRPSIVVEVVGEGGRHRDYVEKREEYLRAGIDEYWIVDPKARLIRVHLRAGDTWVEADIPAGAIHRTRLLPGLEVRPADLIGPADLL